MQIVSAIFVFLKYTHSTILEFLYLQIPIYMYHRNTMHTCTFLNTYFHAGTCATATGRLA